MVSSFCCCPQVNARVNQVLSATGIDPASGERDPMRGDVDIRTLVESITKQMTETTPIGKRFERLETAQGQPVTRADRELVFERLCLQMCIIKGSFSKEEDRHTSSLQSDIRAQRKMGGQTKVTISQKLERSFFAVCDGIQYEKNDTNHPTNLGEIACHFNF